MKFRKEKILYNRNIKAGIILSLSFAIALFYFFPAIEESSRNIRHNEFAIVLSDVPATLQESSGRTAPAAPALPSIILPDENLETVLDNVEITADAGAEGNGSAAEESDGSAMGASENGSSQFPSGRYIPRQILEVFPEKTRSKQTGEVRLSLKIGADGKVISHRVIQNTTGSEECLANSINAAYKSKWSPIGNEDFSSEYWIEKKYEFR